MKRASDVRSKIIKTGGKGKMKKSEKITNKVLKVVERIARNEVEKNSSWREGRVFGDLSPAKKTEEKRKLSQNVVYSAAFVIIVMTK